MSKNQELLKAAFPDLNLSFDLSLAPKTYFKIGGSAEIFYRVKDLALAKKLLHFCETEQIPWTIIGGASNVVIADEGISGLVLQLAFNDFIIFNRSQKEATVEAQAGIKTSVLVMEAAKLGYTGLEGFIGVPGYLGGAIYNNAHYLDQLIGDYIEEVTVFHVKKNEELIFSREKCAFAYEKSIFQTDKNYVILSAKFKLKKANPRLIKEKIVTAQAKRTSTQPLNLPSSGCIFQNPKNTSLLKEKFPQFKDKEFIPAGFLIDQAGLKGEQIGQIQVSPKHAAFLVNLADSPASDKDVKKLISLIKEKIKNKYQVDLKEEVFYLPAKKQV